MSIDQIGDLNELRLTEDGARNYVEGIIQNNRGVAISGNRVTLTLGGDDNGGDGLGGAGSFALIPAGFLRFQAQVSQIGDDNGISYVTAANSTASHYGFAQEGDGNGIIGTVSGTGNEVSISQIGDDNEAVFRQDGDRNAFAASASGERNRVAATQAGSDNIATVSIAGDGNNGVAGGARLTGTRRAVAAAAGLRAGTILQDGSLNRFQLVLSGDLNVFAASQRGDDNRIYGFVDGSGNEAVVTQEGPKNVARYRQTGDGNRAAIAQ